MSSMRIGSRYCQALSCTLWISSKKAKVLLRLWCLGNRERIQHPEILIDSSVWPQESLVYNIGRLLVVVILGQIEWLSEMAHFWVMHINDV
jgi:hypothetical protein